VIRPERNRLRSGLPGSLWTWAVGQRSDDLLRGAFQVVVGVEELLLQAFFAFHELDVVNQQDVTFPVAPLKVRCRVRSESTKSFMKVSVVTYRTLRRG